MWSPACPTLQQCRDTGGRPQLTALQPLLLLGARKQSAVPQSRPSRHILKCKKSVLHHLLGRAHANKSSRRSEPCRAVQGARPPDMGPITWPALYPWPRLRAWFRMRSGRRSVRGDKGRPGSRQWSCAPQHGRLFAEMPRRGHRHVLPRHYLLVPLVTSRKT